LTIQLNASLDAGAYDLAVTGTFTNNGTLYREAGGSVSQIDAGAGITEYRTADGAIQDYGSPGVDYSNLRINGVAATLGSDLEVSGNLVFAGGGTLGIGGNTLSVGGDISGTGTLAGGAGSVSVTGSMTVSAYSGTSGTTTVGNDWGVAAYTHNDGTVVFDGTGNLGTGTFYDLENASGTRTLTGAVAVENGLTITGGTIDADGNSIDVSGNWTNDAGATGFTHGNNMVSFTDAGKTSVITGGTTFYDFTCTAAGKTIQFEEGAAQAQTVEHTFTIQGTSGGGNAVTLARSGSTTQWYINVGTSSSIEYVAVSYSNASGGIQIDAYHSTNNGNNTNWNFINDVSIVTRQTIDSDADGFIDRIRIVTDRDINDVFDGLTMTVSGYTLNTITPFETGGGSRDSEFFINLVERDTPDTGATPGIRVTYNDSLMDDLTESVYLAIDAFPTPADDNAAPILLYTLAAAGGSNMYIRFSEYVYGNATMSALIDENDFNYAAGTGITPLTQSGSGVSDCFLRVGAAFTEDEIAGDTFNALAGSIFDQTGTLTVGTAVHPVSYLGLGVIAPAWATDGTDTITAFDGTEGLPDADITLEASILAPSLTGAATRIHYDVNVPSSFKNGNLWLPASIPVLVPAANTEARDLAENSAAGALRDYIVPESDSEIVENVRVEFILQVGTVFCARVTSPDDPRTVRPWAFEIKGITWQSDNVTILNNVINPGNGDTTTLLYKLEKSGIVTIMVFDLKGDIVDVLQRGRQNQGEYTVTWDGRNRGNRIVASGVYFIKIVAPGIEEIRKVLVVK
ncbi:MAG: T9SS type A sorting domain-containing protein, partial [Spirochaetales bacterium]|nr:T9SS type A sorting domain-containing protein [Spirochaetales bacterium]